MIKIRQQTSVPYYWELIDEQGIVRAISPVEDCFDLKIKVLKKIFVETYHNSYPEESFGEL